MRRRACPRSLLRYGVVLLSALALALPAAAASHLEALDGNLSSDPGAPTSLVLDPGSNPVEGGVSIPTGNDFLHVTVPAGHVLAALELTAYDGASVSFLGIQAGSTWTAGEFFEIEAADLLGWAHFGAAGIGSDLLPGIAAGTGAQGFVPPLGPGDYTILLQETGVVETGFGFDLQVAAAPEPGPALALASAAALAGLAARRRR